MCVVCVFTCIYKRDFINLNVLLYTLCVCVCVPMGMCTNLQVYVCSICVDMCIYRYMCVHACGVDNSCERMGKYYCCRLKVWIIVDVWL